jgi:uroporphyrinogen-III synthase
VTSSHATVVLASSDEALSFLGPRLRRHGVTLVRLRTVVPRPWPARPWLRTIPGPTDFDTVVATSLPGIRYGVRPWLRHHRAARSHRLEFWAAGPASSALMRRVTRRPVRRAPDAGAEALVRAFTSGPRRSILYFRSLEAGPSLARQLRQLGPSVREVVCYRLGPAPPLGPRALGALERAAVLVATSPSALAGLRGAISAPTFGRLRVRVPLIVLGDRSLRAARGHGFRTVRVVRPSSAQHFTAALLAGLSDGRT